MVKCHVDRAVARMESSVVRSRHPGGHQHGNTVGPHLNVERTDVLLKPIT